MNITKEEVQQVLDALQSIAKQHGQWNNGIWAAKTALEAHSLLQSKLSECPHGVGDGACKECYNEAVKDDGEPVTDFDIRGKLSTLKCWHRLTAAESQDLIKFYRKIT